MELILPDAPRRSRTRHDDVIELFYGTEDELEYPKTGEFQAVVDLLQQFGEEECRGPGTFLQALERCPNTCDKPILSGYSLAAFRGTEIELRRSTMNGYGIKLEQEYTPVRLGKWSKVICEFRHRYCQDTENTYQNTCVPSSGVKFVDNEQTRPKASTEEQNYARVAKKLGECLQTKSSPYMSPDKEHTVTLNDSGIHSPSSSPLDLSANLVDIYPEGDGPKKPCSKIYVDLKTRRFTCDACSSSFDSLEDAELHLVGADEPLLCNDDACVPRDSDDSQDVPRDTDKCHDGQEPENESEGASSDHPPANNHGQLQEYATLDVKDVANCNGSKLGKETELHVPRDALDSTFARGKRKKRRKKKNKPWRLMKRTFLLALGALF